MIRPPTGSTLFPYPTLFRSRRRTEPGVPSPVVLVLRFSTPPTVFACLGQPQNDSSPPTVRHYRQPSAVTSRFAVVRSEEHTSELQSHSDLLCRLLLYKI